MVLSIAAICICTARRLSRNHQPKNGISSGHRDGGSVIALCKSNFSRSRDRNSGRTAGWWFLPPIMGSLPHFSQAKCLHAPLRLSSTVFRCLTGRQRKSYSRCRCRQDAEERGHRRRDKAVLRSSPAPPIRPLPNPISITDPRCPQAALNSREAFTTRRGIRCRETKALDTVPIVIGGAFRSVSR